MPSWSLATKKKSMKHLDNFTELYNRQILAYFIVYILLHYHGDFIEKDKMLYKK